MFSFSLQQTFFFSFWDMVVLPGICEFSDLSVEGKMEIRAWSKPSVLLQPKLSELKVLSGSVGVDSGYQVVESGRPEVQPPLCCLLLKGNWTHVNIP